MPNFIAQIRGSYRDMDAIVFDGRHSGLALAPAVNGSYWTNSAHAAPPERTGSHTGGNNAATLLDSARAWTTNAFVGRFVYNTTDGSCGLITANDATSVTATLAGGVDNDWDTGDVYVIAVPRFGDAVQATAGNRPTVTTVGGFNQADFSKAASSHMTIPLTRTLPAGHLTAAFEFAKGTDATNGQTILGLSNASWLRRNAGGNYEVVYGGVTTTGAGDLADGSHLWTRDTGWSRNNVVILAPAGATVEVASATEAARIGGAFGGGNYVDGVLRSLIMWRRQLAPLEIDLAHWTSGANAAVSPEFSYNAYARVTLGAESWTDDTDPAQPSRVNSGRVPQRFYYARASSWPARIQIAGLVAGIVQPDSTLGGNLFTVVPLEYPAVGPPACYSTTGWSSVWDVRLNADGHYLLQLYRPSGGSVLLHVDAKV